MKSIAVNDADALDNTIEPSNQQAVARVVLTDRLTEVSGVAAAADATTTREIVVFPENSAKWGHRTSTFDASKQTRAAASHRWPAAGRALSRIRDRLPRGRRAPRS